MTLHLVSDNLRATCVVTCSASMSLNQDTREAEKEIFAVPAVCLLHCFQSPIQQLTMRFSSAAVLTVLIREAKERGRIQCLVLFEANLICI